MQNSNTPVKSIQCPLCGRIFKTIQSLKTHSTKSHFGIQATIDSQSLLQKEIQQSNSNETKEEEKIIEVQQLQLPPQLIQKTQQSGISMEWLESNIGYINEFCDGDISHAEQVLEFGQEAFELVKRLSPSQYGALKTVVQKSKQLSNKATKQVLNTIEIILQRKDIVMSAIEVLYRVRECLVKSEVTVNFKSELLKTFVIDRIYRSCFEIKKSQQYNKVRETKEGELFNGEYNDATAYERCRYGALNFLGRLDGISLCRGYGDSFFVLSDSLKLVSTWTYQDSFTVVSQDFGTFTHFDHVINKFKDIELQQIIERVIGVIGLQDNQQYQSGTTYKEVQIHTDIDFGSNVQSIRQWKGCDKQIVETFRQKYPKVIFE